mmetsp:Transcript_26312/g.39853  ORF Transcript_26312/g.39853 Transcript_26312/m.39853 type:complete len:285 (-) Transcript_26312:55-909(-)
MTVFEYITSAAVSFTMSGNTGISPFLTLFLMGVLERMDGTLLNMDGWIEQVVSSWAGLISFGVLACVEFAGKCIPAVDALIDSINVFVVPVMSVLSTLGSIGLLDAITDATSGRRLAMGETALLIFKICLVLFGAILALLIHLCKLLLRLIGLACCAGFCQPFITIVETTTVVSCVFLAVYIKQVAIATAVIFFILAGYGVKKRFIDKKKKESEEEEDAKDVKNNEGSEETSDEDEERPKGGTEAKKEATPSEEFCNNVTATSEEICNNVTAMCCDPSSLFPSK